MDVRIRERLVGALVLVAVVVLLVPALLRGPGAVRDPSSASGVRSVEIMLDGVATPNESERLVPEPETAQPKSDDARAAPESLPGPQPAARPAQATPAQQPAWAVQLGAFSTRGKADRLVTELRSRGYAAFVLEYRADGKLLHRVRVGPEQNRERAAAIAARLRKDGFQPVVAPHP
jgi:DedD protein